MKSKFILTSHNYYVGVDDKNKPTITSNINKAISFNSREKAENFLKSSPKKIVEMNWSIVDLNYAYLSNQDNSNYDIESEVENIEDFVKHIYQRQYVLNSELETVNKEIVDIEHAAEFYTLNAAQGYKLYKLLHDARVRRRECKDELAKISYILDGKFNDCITERISRQINGLENRKYRPRVLAELFT